jgi:peptide/nickel transport system permease protein
MACSTLRWSAFRRCSCHPDLLARRCSSSVFGLKLGWLPVVGYVSFSEDPWAALLYMAMPSRRSFLHEIGVLIRMARASTLEVLRLDYITHARRKGLSESAVLWRHAFKNAFGRPGR